MNKLIAVLTMAFACFVMAFGLSAGASAATGEDTPDYSVSSTQSVFRSSTQGVVKDQAVDGEVRTGSQGTTRASFKAELDARVTCPGTLADTDALAKGYQKAGGIMFKGACG